MAWIFRVETPAPAGSGLTIDYVGSCLVEEAAARDAVQALYPPQTYIYTAAKITEAELVRFGVAAGRTQAIQYAGRVGSPTDEADRATQQQSQIAGATSNG